MFKRIVFILLLLTTGSFFVMAHQNQQDDYQQYRKVGAPLPELKIIAPTGETYTQKDFKTKNHFILIIFSPTCSHCIHEAMLIGQNEDLFAKTPVVFMARSNMMPYFADFIRKTKIDEHPQFKLGVDSAQAMDKIYNYRQIPQINIYDKKMKLVKTFIGTTPLDSLKQYLP